MNKYSRAVSEIRLSDTQKEEILRNVTTAKKPVRLRWYKPALAMAVLVVMFVLVRPVFSPKSGASAAPQAASGAAPAEVKETAESQKEQAVVTSGESFDTMRAEEPEPEQMPQAMAPLELAEPEPIPQPALPFDKEMEGILAKDEERGRTEYYYSGADNRLVLASESVEAEDDGCVLRYLSEDNRKGEILCGTWLYRAEFDQPISAEDWNALAESLSE